MKELEREGFPVVIISSVPTVPLTVGANRIVPAVSIPHPLGNPELSQEEEYKLRKNILIKALKALATDVKEQHVFD